MKSKKFKILLSIPLGGFGGFFAGLVTTSFIPLCCGDSGCHNCFEITLNEDEAGFFECISMVVK